MTGDTPEIMTEMRRRQEIEQISLLQQSRSDRSFRM
jgi:hypothetical protein